MKSVVRCVVVAFAIFLSANLVYLTLPQPETHSSGSDTPPPQERPQPVQPERYAPPPQESGKGEFKARLHVADHVKDANILHLEIQIAPTEHGYAFPGVSTDLDQGYTYRTETWADIVIRGISVPDKHPSPVNSIEEIERETHRFDGTIEYLRQIVMSSPYLIVANPVRGIYNDIVADVYVVHGGMRLNVAEMMMNDGHALPDSRNWSWGKPIPTVSQ